MGFGGDATAGVLWASGCFLFALVISFRVGHKLRPAWGLTWFAGAMGLTLVRGLLACLPRAMVPWLPHAAALLAAAALAFLFVGLRFYLDRPLRHPWLWVLGATAMWFVLRRIFELLGEGPLSGPLASGAMFSYFACTSLMRLRSFSGGAYAFTAAVLAFHPVFVLGVGAYWLGAGLDALRGWAAAAMAMVGLGLLMAAMGRLRLELEDEIGRRCLAEASLRESNLLLEVRVKDRTAELESLVGDLESFNRMVSHDLRGPLGGVRGMAEVCLAKLRTGDVSKLPHYLQVIQQEADRLARLVNQLLSIAKIMHTEVERSSVSLDEVLAQALETLRLTHGDAAVACVKSQSLPMGRVDPLLLQQVFVNLVGNALKFSQTAEHPEVIVGHMTNHGDTVVFVQDNGPGFKADEARDLFQPFKRLSGAQVDGHGIGLSIVRRIVERHGGRVWAEGVPGAGAKFFFSLPN